MESVEAPIRTEPALSWFADHAEGITGVVRTKLPASFSDVEAARSLGRPIDSLPSIDPTKREVTEMRVCPTWKDIDSEHGLPPGFNIKTGKAYFDGKDMGSHIWIEHRDQNGKRKIMCHSSAQFPFAVNRDLHKGDGVKELQRRAIDSHHEELVSLIDEYCVVYGDAKDIEENLKIIFEPEN
jgi:hypothetical protein